MARVELVLGVVRFISGFILKKQSLSDFLVFSRKKLIQKEILKNAADVFCNISFTMGGGRDSYRRKLQFFHLLPLVALYSHHFLRNQALLTSTNSLDKTD